MPTIRKVNEDTDPKTVLKEEVGDEQSLIAPTTAKTEEQLDDYARQLKFMAEPVEVMILPSHDQDDTTRLVSISVNGKEYYFLRGEWRTCPRFVLEVIATAKHQAWNFGYKQAPSGTTVQTQHAVDVLRFPHQYRDTNPKGYAWYESIKNMVR